MYRVKYKFIYYRRVYLEKSRDNVTHVIQKYLHCAVFPDYQHEYWNGHVAACKCKF